ncbi:lycopene cyclase domain-containing protein [Nocardioides acrostichi]|uniref:Lycopene cyclase domain-containing protein n=1 Tax=Nocardioides acrostichi TaxID=2784339 RepID=A0A930UXW2_9ACTN|nr:lycopene cyclase domain-containing protein [Nocardioides acrostichi]MBF4160276.1 lycopene cyclase domain-containing protein [Nocardioides acrostichi]
MVYTLTAVLSVVVVLTVELLWLRTGVLRTARFWLAMIIVLAFQVPVDGWLTKLSHPVVRYAPADMTGWRFPWDIPVEDFAFGFGMVTLTILVWVRLGRRAGEDPS